MLGSSSPDSSNSQPEKDIKKAFHKSIADFSRLDKDNEGKFFGCFIRKEF
jgi:hypothetical protein